MDLSESEEGGGPSISNCPLPPVSTNLYATATIADPPYSHSAELPRYQKILDILRLASFARDEVVPSQYLSRLASQLAGEIEAEMNAWKTLLSYEGGDVKEATALHPALPFSTTTNSSNSGSTTGRLTTGVVSLDCCYDYTAPQESTS